MRSAKWKNGRSTPGNVERQYPVQVALAATAANLVADCKELYDSLVTNVRAGLGADDP